MRDLTEWYMARMAQMEALRLLKMPASRVRVICLPSRINGAQRKIRDAA